MNISSFKYIQKKKKQEWYNISVLATYFQHLSINIYLVIHLFIAKLTGLNFAQIAGKNGIPDMSL